MINTINLPPFKKMCVTIGNLPSSFMESMSYYEALCWLYDYFEKTLIPAINTNSEAITELQTAFITLKSYVDNYFDDLDVQTEINNKLDAMAEGGELETIIAAYINANAILGFNTVADMKASEILIDGSFAETLGYHTKNDGGCGLYKIREITNEDIVDEATIIALHDESLIAELIVKDEVINLKQFGVYGDNTHDDTDTIQAAIDYSESKGYAMYIPKGDYLISDELNITGLAITGESATNTIFHLDNTDGFLLNQYNKQNICVIKNLGFKSDTANLEIAGITYKKYDSGTNTRSRGYKLTNLHFSNLGCAIEIQDAFRNTLTDIGINNCFRAVFIKEQVVQCSFINIVANNDLPANSTSTRFGDTRNSNKSIGIQIGVSGETNRPEGIKLNQVCMTNYNLGCYMYDCLYFTATQCEFDLCQDQCVCVYGGTGGITFDTCWLANKAGATLPMVDLLVSNTTVKTNPKRILNCTLINYSAEEAVDGIHIGRNTQFGYNYGVTGCMISNASGAALQYGIVSNKCKDVILADNNVHGCSTQDIRLYGEDGNRLMNNVTDNLQVTIYSGKKLYATGNVYTNKTITNNGTLIGNFD